MKQPKLPTEPGALIGFFEEGLSRLGAVCDRTWYDRLEVLAEGAPARLWRDDGALHNVELQFPAPGATGQRDAATQVFPGCPLTFRLVESLWNTGAPQARVALAATEEANHPPAPGLAEKIWHQQFGQPAHFDPNAWERAWHFSLVAAVRCEIQAIDQHWSFHRAAFALATGERDDRLAAELDFQDVHPTLTEPVPWPVLTSGQWQAPLANALLDDLSDALGEIKRRQELYLIRELHRLDEYFTHYEQELAARLARQHKADSQSRYQDRLTAARAEHARRRDDQVHRHEIRVIPHVDALLLAAEVGWAAAGHWRHGQRIAGAVYSPRARRWFRSLHDR